MAVIVLFLACHGGSDRSDPHGPGSADDTGPPPDTAPPTDTAPPADTGPTDADADGWPAADDCDDTNPWVHPGAAEWCDPLDHDCDGAPLAPGICGEVQLADALWTTSWLPRDEWADDTFSAMTGPVGDLDGDGASEWLGSCGMGCTEAEYPPCQDE